MATKEVVEFLEAQDWEYIVALRRRRCVESARAVEVELTEQDQRLGDLYVREVVGAGDELAEEEWALAAQAGRRLLVCLNPKRQQEERQKRAEKMEGVGQKLEALQRSVHAGHRVDPQKIVAAATRILSRHNGTRYFTYRVPGRGQFEYEEKSSSLAYEQKLDGKFVLLARAQKLNAPALVEAYKELCDVEWAFRSLKSFERIRPIYHWNERRVRGHVWVCVLALLLERVMQRKLDQAKLALSSEMALSSLRTIKVVPMDVAGREFIMTTPVSAQNQKILNALGVKPPPRLLAGEPLNDPSS
jgi:transposase